MRPGGWGVIGWCGVVPAHDACVFRAGAAGIGWRRLGVPRHDVRLIGGTEGAGTHWAADRSIKCLWPFVRAQIIAQLVDLDTAGLAQEQKGGNSSSSACALMRPETASPRIAFLARLEERLAAELAPVRNVYVVTTAQLADAYPVAEYYDLHADKLGHIPFTTAFFTALGTMIARKIYALQAVPYKVIALDCDQTLWQGICGEDGVAGIVIDPARALLQQFIVEQRELGKLICLCSKNNQADVAEVFAQRPEMPLRWEHLTAWRINWRPKSENLKALADELHLGLDSRFLDYHDRTPLFRSLLPNNACGSSTNCNRTTRSITSSRPCAC